MKPELKAFRFYRKNIHYYLHEMVKFWGDDKKLLEMYDDVAKKFGTTGQKLMEINIISYERSIERAIKNK